MEIGFTEHEGGTFQYFNSPLTDYEIRVALDEALKRAQSGDHRQLPCIHEETHSERERDDCPFSSCEFFYPDGDTLPKFHSLILPNGDRWDAYNCKWKNDGDEKHVAELFAVLKKRANWIGTMLYQENF